MAALPFHYFLALREDWIKTNTVPEKVDVDASPLSPVDDVLGTFGAESLKGEMA